MTAAAAAAAAATTTTTAATATATAATTTTTTTTTTACWPAGDVRQDKEDPDMNEYDEENVKEEFADDLFTQIQRTVDDDEHKLSQQHR